MPPACQQQVLTGQRGGCLAPLPVLADAQGQREDRNAHPGLSAGVTLEKPPQHRAAWLLSLLCRSRIGPGSLFRNNAKAIAAKALLTICSLTFAWYRNDLKMKPKS